jgi:hypothetical protein
MSSYAVVDPDHERMAVFGGYGFGYLSDTWTLDLASAKWTRMVGDTTHPGPRMEYASIHDPVRRRMIVFGGKDPFTSEVWALDLSATPTWSLLATAGTPRAPGIPRDLRPGSRSHGRVRRLQPLRVPAPSQRDVGADTLGNPDVAPALHERRAASPSTRADRGPRSRG